MRMTSLFAAVVLVLPACADEVQDAAPSSSRSLEWAEPVLVASGEAHAGRWRMNRSDFRYVDDPTVALFPDGDAGVAWVDQAAQTVRFQRFGPDGADRPSEPVDVPDRDSVFSWLPRLAITEQGRVHALWQEIVFSGGSHGGEIFFASSTDGGRSFAGPVNLSETTHGAGKGRLSRRYWHNGSLDLAAGTDGALFAAWSEYQGPLRVRTSTDGGRSWSEAVTVAGGNDALPARGPALAVGPNGKLHLAWSVGEAADADIHYAVSDDGGRSWSTTRHPEATSGHADAPKLAVAEDGSVHAVWMESPEGPLRDYRVRYARLAPGQDGFGAARTLSNPLAEDFADARFPYLALDGEGNPYVLFELYREGQPRGEGLALVYSEDGGESFGSPASLPRGGEEAAGFNGSRQGMLMDKLAVAESGEVVVVNSTFDEGEASHVWLMRGR